MEMIRSTAACACFMGIITAAADMICPSGKYGNRIKLILVLIFLSTVISGFGNSDIDLDIQTSSSFDKEAESSRADDYFLAAAEKNIADSVKNELKSRGINADKISVSVNISEDGGIYISKADVFVNESDAGRTAEAVGDIFGEDVTVNVNKETGEENESGN